MPRPNFTFIKIDDHLAENRHLFDRSKADKERVCGALGMAVGYCHRQLNDGFIEQSEWQKIVTSTGRRLLVSCQFAEEVPGGVQIRHYLDYYPSRAQVQETSEKARKAAHTRWHGDADRNADRTAVRNADRIAGRIGSGDAVRSADRNADRNAESESEKEFPPTPRQSALPSASGGAPGSARSAGRASRSEPTPRAGDRPPPARELCRRCGGDHDTRSCPTLADAGDGSQATGPDVLERGAQRAREAISDEMPF
jgi:hypothetical protein